MAQEESGKRSFFLIGVFGGLCGSFEAVVVLGLFTMKNAPSRCLYGEN